MRLDKSAEVVMPNVKREKQKKEMLGYMDNLEIV